MIGLFCDLEIRTLGLFVAFACCFGFALALDAGFHVMLTTLDFGENTRFLDLLLETFESTFDTFARVNLDFSHLTTPLSRNL